MKLDETTLVVIYRFLRTGRRGGRSFLFARERKKKDEMLPRLDVVGSTCENLLLSRHKFPRRNP